MILHDRILLLEDNEEDARIVRHNFGRYLNKKVEIVHYRSVRETLEHLEDDTRFDAILTDLHVIDSIGIETVKSILSLRSNIPIIILSDTSDDSLATEAVAEGAQDYITKRELLTENLSRKVNYAAERQRLFNELSEAKMKLLEQSELKSRFMAQISHEIRTPMNGVIGNASVLLHTKLDEEQRQVVEAIRNSGETLLSIINDILDFSKFDSDSIALRPQKFCIRQLVEEVIEAVAGLANKKRILITDIISPQVPREGYADPNRLKQILYNLVSNGIKYTDEGYVVISVTTASNDEGQGQLRFEVKDTGRGISKSAQEDLFEPFTQARYQDQFIGTGLGLSICHRLTRLMGGSIGVDSRLNRGSTFWFQINCKLNDAIPNTSRANLDQKKVLVFCEENDPYESILLEQISRRGMMPVTVHDPNQIQANLRSEDFSLRVVCHHGENDNAFQEVLKILGGRNTRGYPSSTLILTTREQKKGLPAEFSNVIPFPVPQSKLYDTAARLIENKREKQQQPVSAKTPKVSQKTRAPKLHANVLVVDDTQGNLDVASRMLRVLGCRSTLADSGRMALELCQNQAFDIILMDCRMPELSGFDTLKLIRETDNKNRQTPVVALTANAFASDRDECLGAGMNGFLAKPIQIANLATALSHCLKQRTAETPTEAVAKTGERPVSVFQEGVGNQYLDEKTIRTLRELEDPNDAVPFLQELIDTYRNDTPDIIANLSTSIEELDRRGVEHYAHKLKGFSRNLGLRLVAQSCEELESNSYKYNKDELNRLFHHMESYYRLSVKELSKLYESRSA